MYEKRQRSKFIRDRNDIDKEKSYVLNRMEANMESNIEEVIITDMEFEKGRFDHLLVPEAPEEFTQFSQHEHPKIRLKYHKPKQLPEQSLKYLSPYHLYDQFTTFDDDFDYMLNEQDFIKMGNQMGVSTLQMKEFLLDLEIDFKDGELVMLDDWIDQVTNQDWQKGTVENTFVKDEKLVAFKKIISMSIDNLSIEREQESKPTFRNMKLQRKINDVGNSKEVVSVKKKFKKAFGRWRNRNKAPIQVDTTFQMGEFHFSSKDHQEQELGGLVSKIYKSYATTHFSDQDYPFDFNDSTVHKSNNRQLQFNSKNNKETSNSVIPMPNNNRNFKQKQLNFNSIIDPNRLMQSEFFNDSMLKNELNPNDQKIVRRNSNAYRSSSFLHEIDNENLNQNKETFDVNNTINDIFDINQKDFDEVNQIKIQKDNTLNKKLDSISDEKINFEYLENRKNTIKRQSKASNQYSDYSKIEEQDSIYQFVKNNELSLELIKNTENYNISQTIRTTEAYSSRQRLSNLNIKKKLKIDNINLASIKNIKNKFKNRLGLAGYKVIKTNN